MTATLLMEALPVSRTKKPPIWGSGASTRAQANVASVPTPSVTMVAPASTSAKMVVSTFPETVSYLTAAHSAVRILSPELSMRIS